MNVDLMGIVNRSDNELGHKLVAPSFHVSTKGLPEDARESANFFAAKMLNTPNHALLTAIENTQGGSTDKVHFRVGGRLDERGRPIPSSIFMVKPYYENLRNWQYGPYPLSGWAEMTYQGLLKAANLEHLAMKLHTFPYGDSALLGIELEPGLHPIGATLPPPFYDQQPTWSKNGAYGKVEFPAHIKDDASKVGALDFLLNNQDRNFHNLMMAVDDHGRATSILPIDNGLSGQFIESNRFAMYGNKDNLFWYLKAPAYRAILKDGYSGPLRAIATWWKQVKPKVVSEFIKHAQGIEHPGLANHIVSSFQDRVHTLDAATADFEKYGAKPYTDYLEGYADNENKQIFHRASVYMRPWEPPADDPLPRPPKEPEDSCPTCGETYDASRAS